jgi:nucleoside-diphosphate-sugar epimerase
VKVLVVGGAGYIGSVLVTRLAGAGHDVAALDGLVYGSGASLAALDSAGVRLWRADMRDPQALRAAMSGVDAVVHLGGFVGEPASDLDPSLTVQTNYAAPVLAAELAADLGVGRFVFASTCSVYGVQETEADETCAPNPISLYARTKLLAERAVLRRLAGGQVFALRLATVFGLSPRMRLDSVVNKLAVRAARGLPLELYGGTQWRPFVAVSDVADVVERLLTGAGDGRLDGVTNVGSAGQTVTIAELARLIGKVCPTEIVVAGQPEDGRSYQVRFDRLHGALPGACGTGLVEGVEAICAAAGRGDFGDPAAVVYDNYRGLRAALATGDLSTLDSPAMRALTAEFHEGDRDVQ